MIDKIYIESARSIRTEFLKLNTKLESYKTELVRLVKVLSDVSIDLENLSKNEVNGMRNKSDIPQISDKLIKKINEVEEEEQKIISLVKPINEKLEKLRKEEEILFKMLKQKYPKIKEDALIKEIQSKLEK